MTRHNTHLSRRIALRTAAGAALASVAGCLGEDSTGSPSDQDLLQQITFEETALIVEFSSAAQLDRVNLIQPNGELFAQQEVAAGSQQISLDIGTSYPSGKYRVVAFEDDEPIAESTIAIKPELSILHMGIGKNQPEKMWDGPEDEIQDEAFVTVENRGSGPESITKLLFLGEVPYPSDEEGTNYVENEDVSGIYDPDTDSEVDDAIIDPGEQLTIFSSRSPFAFVPGAGTACSNEQQTGKFELILGTRVDGDQVTKTYSIQYSAAAEWDNCEITIKKE